MFALVHICVCAFEEEEKGGREKRKMVRGREEGRDGGGKEGWREGRREGGREG